MTNVSLLETLSVLEREQSEYRNTVAGGLESYAAHWANQFGGIIAPTQIAAVFELSGRRGEWFYARDVETLAYGYIHESELKLIVLRQPKRRDSHEDTQGNKVTETY